MTVLRVPNSDGSLSNWDTKYGGQILNKCDQTGFCGYVYISSKRESGARTFSFNAETGVFLFQTYYDFDSERYMDLSHEDFEAQMLEYAMKRGFPYVKLVENVSCTN